MRVMFISQQYPNLQGWDEVSTDVRIPQEGAVPSRADLEQADVLLLMGQWNDTAYVTQLAGVIALALPRGLTVVLAYPVVIDDALRTLVGRLTGAAPSRLTSRQTVRAAHPAFADFFKVYGESQENFALPDDSEAIGTISIPSNQGATAFVAQRSGGLVYLIPFYLAGAHTTFLREMFTALLTHRDELATAVPEFLSELRLPGEADLLIQIAEEEAKTQTLRDRAHYLEKFRHIIGRASGTKLEDLIIETLNVILDGSGHRAEDREELRAEDFWIVGPEGDFALAEVKGHNSHIRLDDVNQVDSHRDEAGEVAGGLPGLLVINIFRGHADLEQRQLPVSSRAIQRGSTSDVLILRTFDVLNLLHRKMAGENAGAIFLEALTSGGGWLEVTTHEHTLHKS